MTAPVSVTSLIAANMGVTYDQWAANPLLEDAMQAAPQTVALAKQTGGDPPAMFQVGGDAPPFTASGMDPRFLKVMPWRIRHAAAVNPDMGAVLGWVQQYAYEPDVDMPCQGQGDYIKRFRAWLAGTWTNPTFTGADPEKVAAANDDFMETLFGASNAARAKKIAEVNATYRPVPRTALEREQRAAEQQAGRAQR